MSSDAERLREMADTLEPGSTHLEPFRRELREIAARATLAASPGAGEGERRVVQISPGPCPACGELLRIEGDGDE